MTPEPEPAASTSDHVASVPAAPPRVKPFDGDLRDRLDHYRQSARPPLTISALARQLGLDSSRVSKYLSGKPEGDVQETERIVADVLKAAARNGGVPADQRVWTFETSVSRTLESVLESLRRTGGTAVLTGGAGVGKTVAVEMYAAKNPSVIAIHATQWARGGHDVRGLLWAAMETASWDGFTKREPWMIERLRGSRRLVIVDKAERLTATALRWLADFREATGCPLALVGQVAVEDVLRADREAATHFGVRRELRLKDPADAAVRMLAARGWTPAEGEEDFRAHAAQVAAERGSLRALDHQLGLAADILGDKKFQGGRALAFRSAHTQLARSKPLGASQPITGQSTLPFPGEEGR